jgi:hypothetical protein
MGDMNQKNEWLASESMGLGSVSTVEMSQEMEFSRIQIVSGMKADDCFCYETVGNGKRDLMLGTSLLNSIYGYLCTAV